MNEFVEALSPVQEFYPRVLSGFIFEDSKFARVHRVHSFQESKEKCPIHIHPYLEYNNQATMCELWADHYHFFTDK